MNLQDLRHALDPLLRLDLPRWHGLPQASGAQFNALFGAPDALRQVMLGACPALHRHYRTDAAAGGLHVWLRDALAVMVQTVRAPDATVLAALPEPTAVLAHEIDLPDAYAHEYLYGPLGLVLTVAQAHGHTQPERIVRCRGIRPLASARAFGPAFYLALEDRTLWTPARFEGAPA
ncbi:MAG: hypothetical protein KDH93_24220 [Rhodoferax sp.]|nr:hypothetical protein [Rhodoferax sp.]